jgi:hypothetical protein
MAALTELVSDIQATIPEIPGFIAERQVLRAARQFCHETRAWRDSFQFSVIEALPTVALGSLIPAGTELVDIISIKNTGGGEPVHPRTYSWLDRNTSDWRSETDLNASYYVRDSNNTIRLSPTPSVTTVDLYDARVAVKPTLAATELEDGLVSRYREELISGALGHLFLIPRKPWTDLNLAQYHKAQFMVSWAGARVAAAEEHQTGVPRKVKYGGL